MSRTSSSVSSGRSSGLGRATAAPIHRSATLITYWRLVSHEQGLTSANHAGGGSEVGQKSSTQSADACRSPGYHATRTKHFLLSDGACGSLPRTTALSSTAMHRTRMHSPSTLCHVERAVVLVGRDHATVSRAARTCGLSRSDSPTRPDDAPCDHSTLYPHTRGLDTSFAELVKTTTPSLLASSKGTRSYHPCSSS